MAKSKREFEEWQEELISDLAREFGVSKGWAREMTKVLVSMSVGYHLGYSNEEYKADQVDVDMAQRAVDSEAALKHMNKQYGIASQKIHLLKSENALLRERLREYEAKPSPIDFDKPLKRPRVFRVGDAEPRDHPVLRSSKPHLTQQPGETFTINKEHKDGPFSGEQWWCSEETTADHRALWTDWDRWLESYGPFTEELND